MVIPKEVIAQIFQQAKELLPEEACGLLAGKGQTVLKHFSMTNTCHGEHHFTFDPAEQFKAVREAKQEALELVGMYHSHSFTSAEASEEENRLIFSENIFHVIISLAEESQDVRAYRIFNGQIIEEEVTVE